MKGNRKPARGPIVDARRAIFTPPRMTQRRRVEELRGSAPWAPPVAGDDVVVAYHEAGHVVAGRVFGMSPARATILPEHDPVLGATLGRVQHRTFGLDLVAISRAMLADPDRGVSRGGMLRLFWEAASALAGPAVEYLWFDDQHPRELFGCVIGDDHSDVGLATDLAERLFGETEHAQRFYDYAAWWVTERLLNTRAARIGLGRVAELLIERKTIGEDEIRDAVPWVNFKPPDLDRFLTAVLLDPAGAP